MLLTANPLADIRHTLQIDAVIVGGRHFPADSLQSMVQRAARALK